MILRKIITQFGRRDRLQCFAIEYICRTGRATETADFSKSNYYKTKKAMQINIFIKIEKIKRHFLKVTSQDDRNEFLFNFPRVFSTTRR